MEFEVLVQLKGEILDPEGRAIQETLTAQKIPGIVSVSVAKRYVVTLSDTSKNPDQIIEDIASKYLANPVAQSYSIKRL